MNWEDLDSLLSKFGRAESCEQVSTECESATVNVVYASRQVLIKIGTPLKIQFINKSRKISLKNC